MSSSPVFKTAANSYNILNQRASFLHHKKRHKNSQKAQENRISPRNKQTDKLMTSFLLPSSSCSLLALLSSPPLLNPKPRPTLPPARNPHYCSNLETSFLKPPPVLLLTEDSFE
jgi:hypothetical protein